MRKNHLNYLACPDCKGFYKLEIKDLDNDIIKNGLLICENCSKTYPIINFIPRFVSQDNYAGNFGLEWKIHSKTQFDSYNKSNMSETRFFTETKWQRDLKKEIILEAGCGSGRFTEQALKTNAMIISMDLSNSVEVNYKNNGHKENLFIVQADIYNLPFKFEFFDKIFCFGVLQHLPNVENGFMSLVKHLKKNGNLVVDVYGIRLGFKGFFVMLLQTKYWIRPLTKRMNSELLYRICKKYIELMWPISKLLDKIPYFGKRLKWILLISDHFKDNENGIILSEDKQKEWTILDTFDMLSPKYDSPQKINTVRKWFDKANLKEIEVYWGYNGIEGRGTKI